MTGTDQRRQPNQEEEKLLSSDPFATILVKHSEVEEPNDQQMQ